VLEEILMVLSPVARHSWSDIYA